MNRFFIGLLVGFGLGIAVGLVFAPQSGEATRAQLSEQGIILRDRSAGLTGQLREHATNALSQGREMYTRTKGELTESYTKAKTGE